MKAMFKNCKNLKKVTLPYIDHNKLQNLEELFFNCISLTTVEYNTDTFNTINVNSMQNMFRGCSSLVSIHFPNNFRTTNCANIGDMFSGCKSLKSIDFNIFETGNIENTSQSDKSLITKRCLSVML